LRLPFSFEGSTFHPLAFSAFSMPSVSFVGFPPSRVFLFRKAGQLSLFAFLWPLTFRGGGAAFILFGALFVFAIVQCSDCATPQSTARPPNERQTQREKGERQGHTTGRQAGRQTCVYQLCSLSLSLAPSTHQLPQGACWERRRGRRQTARQTDRRRRRRRRRRRKRSIIGREWRVRLNTRM